MTTTSYDNAGVSPRVGIFAVRTMLKHAAPVNVLAQLGTSTEMPQNKGETIKWRRPRTFSAQTTPLQEGVTPSATSFRYDDVTATLEQYGQVIETTDKIDVLHEDNVVRDISIQAGENIGRTIEQLNYGVVRAGTNVFYNNGSARTDVNTAVTLAKLRAVVRALMAQKAMRLQRVLDASPNYGTKGIEAAWVAVHHTDIENDIRNLAGFTPVAEYGQRKPINDYETGSVENIRFIGSPDLAPFANGGGTYNGSGTSMVTTGGSLADVYPILVFGKDAWAHVAVRGFESVEPTIIPVSQKTKDDPLGQRGIVGWKTWHAAAITNELWMARLEVAATAL